MLGLRLDPELSRVFERGGPVVGSGNKKRLQTDLKGGA